MEWNYRNNQATNRSLRCTEEWLFRNRMINKYSNECCDRNVNVDRRYAADTL